MLLSFDLNVLAQNVLGFTSYVYYSHQLLQCSTYVVIISIYLGHLLLSNNLEALKIYFFS